MEKIEPALLQFRIDENGAKSKWVRIVGTSEETLKAFGAKYEVRQLWTDDALQAVAEAVLIKLQEEISKRQILNDETAIDRAYNRGLDTADAIVGDFDLAAIINQLKGK